MNCKRLALAVTTVMSLMGLALSAGADDMTETQTASTAQPPADMAALKALFARPTEIPFPKTNPYTPEKAELGKTLFFDPRLSRVAVEACVSCHNPSFGWEDGRKTAVGDNMVALRRNSPSILNRAWGQAFFWDGRAESLEAQATGPITSPGEMNMPMNVLLDRLKAIPGYQQRFQTVFPGEGITASNIAKAIATFERTLISGHSPFDEYVFNGKHTALTPEAKRGMALFYSERLGCSTCHSGFNFSGAWRDAQGATAEPTFANNGIGTAAMRVPTLRNVALTAPYMHDGSLSTLEAVLDHYQQAGQRAATKKNDPDPVGAHDGPRLRSFTLTEAERHELVAFLQSLTDPGFMAGFDGERTYPVSR